MIIVIHVDALTPLVSMIFRVKLCLSITTGSSAPDCREDLQSDGCQKDTMMTAAEVKTFNDSRGYGFISAPGHQQDWGVGGWAEPWDASRPCSLVRPKEVK